MVKFKKLLSNILVQRIFLLSISAFIAREILMGYVAYNNQVIRLKFCKTVYDWLRLAIPE